MQLSALEVSHGDILPETAREGVAEPSWPPAVATVGGYGYIERDARAVLERID